MVPPPPPGIEVEVDASSEPPQLRITLVPWMPVAIAKLLFASLIPIGVVLSLAQAPLFGVILALPFTAFVYLPLVDLVNRRRLVANAEALLVTSGPLPTHTPAPVLVTRIHSFEVQSEGRRGRRYYVVARTNPGLGYERLLELTDRRDAEYLSRLLTQWRAGAVGPG